MTDTDKLDTILDELRSLRERLDEIFPKAPAEHEHYWVDAPDDETAWHCASCGVTEYPEGAFATEDDALAAAKAPDVRVEEVEE